MEVGFFFGGGLGPGGSARAITGETAELKQLADGVYAFIGKRNDANAMVIVTAEGVVLVDTGNNPPETRILQKLVRSVTGEPVRYVVVSQNHGDHIGGAPLFSPPATVIAHERVFKEWAKWKPFQIKAWRKRFAERSAALMDVNPTDTMLTFNDHMTLHLGGKTIELIYVDDRYNPGDVAVWLPESGVLHAAFVGYITRHPDIRPDYSHGTTSGMLKQLEALIALKPKIVVPAHGPLGDVTDLQALTDYLLAARQKVRAMMETGSFARGDREAIQHERVPGLGPRFPLPLDGGDDLPRAQWPRTSDRPDGGADRQGDHQQDGGGRAFPHGHCAERRGGPAADQHGYGL